MALQSSLQVAFEGDSPSAKIVDIDVRFDPGSIRVSEFCDGSSSAIDAENVCESSTPQKAHDVLQIIYRW